MVKRVAFANNRRLLPSRHLLLALAIVASSRLPIAHAQDLANSQCGQYVEAYRGGPSGYTPYLQAIEKIAKSRDAQQASARYIHAFHHSAPSASALWLNNWCTKNPLKGFTEASNLLLNELTGQSNPADATLPAPPQQLVVNVPQSIQPSACTIGDKGVCSGCSASCGNGSTARCKPGATTADGQHCAFTSKCECIFDKNASPPPPALANGPSSCKVGDNSGCSGCSVSCTNGKTATCKQGSLMSDGWSCASQAKCLCK
jgi:hypothetical protein